MRLVNVMNMRHAILRLRMMICGTVRQRLGERPSKVWNVRRVNVISLVQRD